MKSLRHQCVRRPASVPSVHATTDQEQGMYHEYLLGVRTSAMSIYQASKAATKMLSERMRLELAPLDVRVLSVDTGAIWGNIMANTPSAKLPESSYYTPAQGEISDLAADRNGPKRTPSAEFARAVVDDIARGASGKVWRGAMAGTTTIMSAYAPSSVIVWMSLFSSLILMVFFHFFAVSSC